MTALSPEQRDHFEKLLNEYERMREDAQEGMKTVVGELREKLGQLVAKEDLADELAGFRLYVKRRYVRDNHPEKAEKADAKTEIADAYEFQASQGQVYTTRTHSAGRAKLAPIQTEVQTPHDADGVVIEQNATRPDTAAEIMPSLVARVNRPEGDRVIGPDTEEACRSGVRAPADEQNPEPGAGVESLGNGARENPAETMPEPNLGNAAGRTAEDELVSAADESSAPHTEIADELKSPAIQPRVPIQKHTAIDGGPLSPVKVVEPFIPDPSTPRVRNVSDPGEIPAFLQRAQMTGNA